jgi:hypothetical protein
VDGKLHREDGPAVECASGYKEWWLNDLHHREGAPAVEHVNGTKEWYLNGVHHREDGPAFEGVHGYKEWYLHGEELTEQEFNRLQRPMELTLQQIAEKFNVSIDKLRIKE